MIYLRAIHSTMIILSLKEIQWAKNLKGFQTSKTLESTHWTLCANNKEIRHKSKILDRLNFNRSLTSAIDLLSPSWSIAIRTPSTNLWLKLTSTFLSKDSKNWEASTLLNCLTIQIFPWSQGLNQWQGNQELGHLLARILSLWRKFKEGTQSRMQTHKILCLMIKKLSKHHTKHMEQICKIRQLTL